ncbi:MAG: redoxin family protein [Bacteroidetes bacterium]|nr:redoxin family protein [Bacteroidota bacterium]
MKQVFFYVFWLSFFTCFSQLKIKDKAPLQNQSLRCIDETTLSLFDGKKKNGIVVIFTCNSCPFVVGSDDFPGWEQQYDSLYLAAQANEIGFILVNSNEGKRNQADSFEEMKKRALEHNYKMPYLLDNQSQLADAYGAKTTPHVYFFDEDLTLIYTGSIDNSWDKARQKNMPYLFNAMVAKGNAKKIKPNTTEPKGCGIKRIKKPGNK